MFCSWTNFAHGGIYETNHIGPHELTQRVDDALRRLHVIQSLGSLYQLRIPPRRRPEVRFTTFPLSNSLNSPY